MLKRQEVTVVLAPSALEVVLTDRSGQVVSKARRALDPGTAEEAWTGGLMSLDIMLASLLRSLKINRGTHAEVVYSGSDEVVETRVFDKNTKQASQIAQTQMLHELSFDRGLAVTETQEILNDTFKDQSVILSVADRDDRLMALFAWLRRAGLVPMSATPREALAIGEALEELTSSRRASGDTDRIVQWRIGEFDSVLAVSTPDNAGRHKLELVRSIRLGFDALVEALARGLLVDQASAAPSLDFERARKILTTVGIPSHDQLVDPVTGKTGRDVLPLMQPVLQRMAIEAKQTLRFGLEGQEVHSIVTSGPGSKLNGLSGMLAEFLDIDVVAPEPLDPCKNDSADPQGVRTWARDAQCRLSLVPRSVGLQREAGRLANAARLGGIAAVVMLAFSAADAWKTHSQIAEQIDAFRPQVERVRRVAEAEAQTTLIANRVGKVESELYHSMGVLPDWEGLFDEISSLCDDDIRLLALSADASDEISVVELRGAVAESNNGNDEHLSAFLTKLTTCPLLTDVRLESTRRAELRGKPGRRFVIRAQPVAIPTATAIFAARDGDGS